MKTKILLVDDDAALEAQFRLHFRQSIQNGTYEFIFVGDSQQALRILQEQPDIDVLLIGMNGLFLLDQILRINPIVRTILLTANGDVTTIRNAMNRGAFDLITRPIQFPNLKITIDKARQYVHQLRETRELMNVDALNTHVFNNLTHELRSPLSFLLSTINQLCETAEVPFTQPLLSVRRNARQLLQLLNELDALTQSGEPVMELVDQIG